MSCLFSLSTTHLIDVSQSVSHSFRQSCPAPRERSLPSLGLLASQSAGASVRVPLPLPPQLPVLSRLRCLPAPHSQVVAPSPGTASNFTILLTWRENLSSAARCEGPGNWTLTAACSNIRIKVNGVFNRRSADQAINGFLKGWVCSVSRSMNIGEENSTCSGDRP